MSQVRVEVSGNKVVAHTPYHPEFPREAKRLGGKWSGKAWRFDSRHEDRVLKLCRNIYGTDGRDTETVTVRVTFHEGETEFCGGIYLGGRQIAQAWGRDSGASLGDGVILLEGKCYSGGSRKNWTTNIKAGSVVEILDMPIEKAKEVVTDSGRYGWEAEIVEEDSALREKLQAERDRLQQRIDEIDVELAALGEK